MDVNMDSIQQSEIKNIYNKIDVLNKELSQEKVDCEVMKQQIVHLTNLCDKMDTIIEKLMDNQSRTTSEIYNDMEKKRLESQGDIKDIHNRITTIDRSLSDKIELTERRIMEEIKSLKKELVQHNEKEDSDLKKILEWKWMLIGAITLFVWIVSNVSIEKVAQLMQ